MKKIRQQVVDLITKQHFAQAAGYMRQLELQGDCSTAWWAYTLQIGAGLGDPKLVGAALQALANDADMLRRTLLPAWHLARQLTDPSLAQRLHQEANARWPDDPIWHAWTLIHALHRGDAQNGIALDKLVRSPDWPTLPDDLRTGVLKSLYKNGHNQAAQHGLMQWAAEFQLPATAQGREKNAVQLQSVIELALTLKRNDLALTLTESRTELSLRYLRALASSQLLDWQALSKCRLNAQELRALLNSDVNWHPYAPYQFAQLGPCDDKDLRALVQRSSAVSTLGLQRQRRPILPGQQRPSRLRVAYLSGDFRSHPVADLLLPMWRAHDKTRFEWIALDNTPTSATAQQTGQRQRVLACFDQVIPIRHLNDPATARAIRTNCIDIVVSLGGWMVDGREQVLAHSQAPVHIAWLGVPGSLGPPFVDYTVTDLIGIPGSARSAYAEALIRLPVSDRPGGQLPDGQNTSPRQAQGIDDHALVLACFNQHGKITPETFALWCHLLHLAPQAMLWLVDEGPAHRQALEAAACQHGIPPARFRWAAHLPLDQHLMRLACADLVLDTHPFTMHATACNALAAGVPFLTYPGDNPLGRVASSVLHSAGLSDCICRNGADHAQRLQSLVQAPETIARLRQRFLQARQQTPLFNGGVYARLLEHAYDVAFTRHLNSLAPTDLRLQLDH